MKTKKTFSAILALAVILTFGAAVSADNGISGTSSLEISYTTGQNYEIVIPTGNPAIGTDTSLEIEAINVLLPKGKELRVSMSSVNNFALELTAGNVTSSIPYVVRLNGSTVSSGTNVLTVASGETSGEVTLFASVSDASKSTLAGTHTDMLRFTCEIGDKEAKQTGSDSENETNTTSDSNGSSSESGTPVLDAVENKLIQQNSTHGADVPGQAGAAGASAVGGAQEIGPSSEDPRPTPCDPEPEPQPQNPYQYQSK